MSHPSAADLLALHGVRVLGFADAAAVAHRYVLDVTEVVELLLDHEAQPGSRTP